MQKCLYTVLKHLLSMKLTFHGVNFLEIHVQNWGSNLTLPPIIFHPGNLPVWWMNWVIFSPTLVILFTRILNKIHTHPFKNPGQDGAKEEGQVEPVRKDPGLSGMARFHRTNRACFSSKETVVRERNKTPLPPFLVINLSKVQYPFNFG